MMADRSKKEPTPPPLLLMPAGGGLTLNPPDRPNVLMPVIQSEPSLLDPDLEGEADSFVGQGTVLPGPPFSSAAPFPFSQTSAPPSGTDPFADVGKESLQRVHPVEDSSAVAGPGLFPMSSSSHSSPSVIPPPFYSATSGAGPVPPPSQSSTDGASSTNIYRQKGPLRYAQPPAGTYAQTEGQQGASFPPSVPFPSFTPPPTNPPFQPQEPPRSQPPPPTAKVPPMSMGPAPSSLGYGPSPAFGSPPPLMGAGPGMAPSPGMGAMPGVGMGAGAARVEPVIPHWCYCQKVESREIWHPMTMLDNLRLEEALKEGRDVVATDGGRFDVTISKRERQAVYWDEAVTHVRRCTWFYKRERDSRYVPYEEEFAEDLEREYVKAVANNDWHKRLTFRGGETIVMHSIDVVLHFVASSQPDEWGTVQALEPLKGDQMRPRVVKRGVEGLDSFEDGEGAHVDHLVFVVHGIGEMCDVKFRSIIECVDDFRINSRKMLQSHFKQHVSSHRINRVEFLPVHWHRPLHGDATGVDRLLKSITLPSIAKLRHFINDTLMDILFYTSPKYCQLISDTVGQEMNRLFRLYKSRNPLFAGRVSVAGHSLGSSVLLDLLLHQREPKLSNESPFLSPMGSAMTPSDPPSRTEPEKGEKEEVKEPEVEAEAEAEEEPESEMTLEELLTRVGLQDKMSLFTAEQMDMDSLVMCSEQDLKDLGVPMGPRKKLRGFLQEEQERKAKQKEALERKKKEAATRQEMEARMQASDSSQPQGSISVDYICGPAGTGQPSVCYPQLEFQPDAFFALGSPMAIFLAVRGTENVSEDFHLPTCHRVFNIFHPFDPVAYRMEPLINPAAANIKPVLMPHHKGRKRLHLELKDGLSRVGADLKQRFIESFKSTWTSITEFAMAHRSGGSQTTLKQEVDKQMDSVLQEFQQQQQQNGDDKAETGSVSSLQDDDIALGQLNEGQRIDYVLQESPVESFNDYLFALASHGSYWESEDTVLLILKELYAPQGLTPTMPGLDGLSPAASKRNMAPPPSAGSPPHPFMSPTQPPPSEPASSNSAFSMPRGPPPAYYPAGMPPQGGHGGTPPPPGQGQFPMGSPPPTMGNVGPPPMQGFVRSMNR